jgi:hypothetical protein
MLETLTLAGAAADSITAKKQPPTAPPTQCSQAIEGRA